MADANKTPTAETLTARANCIAVLGEIVAMERDGLHGRKEWHRAKDRYQRALRAYYDAGASFVDVATLEVGS